MLAKPIAARKNKKGEPVIRFAESRLVHLGPDGGPQVLCPSPLIIAKKESNSSVF